MGMIDRSQLGRTMTETLVVLGIMSVIGFGVSYAVGNLIAAAQADEIHKRIIAMATERRVNMPQIKNKASKRTEEGPHGVQLSIENGVAGNNPTDFWITIDNINSQKLSDKVAQSDYSQFPAKQIQQTEENDKKQVKIYFAKFTEGNKRYDLAGTCPDHAQCQSGEFACNAGYEKSGESCVACAANSLCASCPAEKPYGDGEGNCICLDNDSCGDGNICNSSHQCQASDDPDDYHSQATCTAKDFNWCSGLSTPKCAEDCCDGITCGTCKTCTSTGACTNASEDSDCTINDADGKCNGSGTCVETPCSGFTISDCTTGCKIVSGTNTYTYADNTQTCTVDDADGTCNGSGTCVATPCTGFTATTCTPSCKVVGGVNTYSFAGSDVLCTITTKNDGNCDGSGNCSACPPYSSKTKGWGEYLTDTQCKCLTGYQLNSQQTACENMGCLALDQMEPGLYQNLGLSISEDEDFIVILLQGGEYQSSCYSLTIEGQQIAILQREEGGSVIFQNGTIFLTGNIYLQGFSFEGGKIIANGYVSLQNCNFQGTSVSALGTSTIQECVFTNNASLTMSGSSTSQYNSFSDTAITITDDSENKARFESDTFDGSTISSDSYFHIENSYIQNSTITGDVFVDNSNIQNNTFSSGNRIFSRRGEDSIENNSNADVYICNNPVDWGISPDHLISGGYCEQQYQGTRFWCNSDYGVYDSTKTTFLGECPEDHNCISNSYFYGDLWVEGCQDIPEGTRYFCSKYGTIYDYTDGTEYGFCVNGCGETTTTTRIKQIFIRTDVCYEE